MASSGTQATPTELSGDGDVAMDEASDAGSSGGGSFFSAEADGTDGQGASPTSRSEERMFDDGSPQGSSLVCVTSVEALLEVMNCAAEELNAGQKDLAAVTCDRDELLERWNTDKAKLVETIGVDRIAKATPYFVQRRVCKQARSAVSRASERYLRAKDGGLESCELARLEAAHRMWVEQHRAAYKDLEEAQVHSGLSKRRLAAAQPYFVAEQEQRHQMAKLDAQVRNLQERVAVARVRYRSAMQHLEAISEETHRLRAMSSEAPRNS
eukprot:TRINITY_DN59317_c0_g1_i1.p1 TRINITY_DN59317_c0_g1~~TRINITY_DN59317_c0_g1_i1.p1  ORF type:complete len:268 (+),score=82.73 TRINITY_DN59317_c0_g1_i1:157-960(+)